MLLFLILSSLATASIYYADGSSDLSDPCDTVLNACSLSSAIDKTSTDDSIILLPGTYPNLGHLTIPNGIHLQGMDFDLGIAQGSRLSGNVSMTVTAASGAVKFSGIYFTGSTFNEHVIVSTADCDLILEDIHIEEIRQNAYFLSWTGNGNVYMTGITAENSDFSEMIFVQNAASVTITDTTITEITATSLAIVRLHGVDSIVVNNLHMSFIPDTALRVDWCSDVLVKNSQWDHNQDMSIMFYRIGDARVDNCTFTEIDFPAGGQGGAVHVWGHGADFVESVVITNCKFLNCVASEMVQGRYVTEMVVSGGHAENVTGKIVSVDSCVNLLLEGYNVIGGDVTVVSFSRTANLTFRNSVVRNLIGSGTVVSTHAPQQVEFENLVIEDVPEGTFTYINQGDVFVIDCVFRNLGNSLNGMMIFNIMNVNDMTIKNTLFEEILRGCVIRASNFLGKFHVEDVMTRKSELSWGWYILGTSTTLLRNFTCDDVQAMWTPAARYPCVIIRFSGGITVENSLFRNNNAWSASGGAMFLDDLDYLTISNTIFEDNYAPSQGSHLIVSRITTVQIYLSQFIDGTGTKEGGAMWMKGCESLMIEDCIFSGNSAERGGALFVEGATLIDIRDSIFNQNVASLSGAVLYSTNTPHSEIAMMDETLVNPPYEINVLNCSLTDNIGENAIIYGYYFVTVNFVNILTERNLGGIVIEKMKMGAIFNDITCVNNTAVRHSCIEARGLILNSIQVSNIEVISSQSPFCFDDNTVVKIHQVNITDCSSESFVLRNNQNVQLSDIYVLSGNSLIDASYNSYLSLTYVGFYDVEGGVGRFKGNQEVFFKYFEIMGSFECFPSALYFGRLTGSEKVHLEEGLFSMNLCTAIYSLGKEMMKIKTVNFFDNNSPNNGIVYADGYFMTSDESYGLILQNCTFQRNVALKGIVFLKGSNNYAHISNVDFIDGETRTGSGIVLQDVSMCEPFVEHCLFKDNVVDVISSDDEFDEPNSCNEDDFIGSILLSEDSNLKASELTFENNVGTCLSHSNGKLLLNDSVFEGCSSGGGIIVSDVEISSTVIDSCEISDCSSISNGAGVNVKNVYETLLISNCIITSNSAQMCGGGLFVESSNIEMLNVEISLNSAGFGGGICLDDSTVENAQNSTILAGNSASSWNMGGGYFDQSGSSFFANFNFKDLDKSSAPSYVQLLNFQYRLYGKQECKEYEKEKNEDGSWKNAFYPGIEFDVELELFDRFDQLLTYYPGFQCSISASNPRSLAFGPNMIIPEFGVDLSGTNLVFDYMLDGNYVPSKAIQFRRLKFELIDLPLDSFLGDEYPIEFDLVIDCPSIEPLVLNITVEDCPRGFMYHTTIYEGYTVFQCVSCPIGTYSIMPKRTKKTKECEKCSNEVYEGLDCSEPHNPKNKDEFWMNPTDKSTDGLVEIEYCDSGRCLGNNSCEGNFDENSPLCAKCKEGYSLWNDECVNCETQNPSLIVVYVFLLLLQLFITHHNSQDSEKGIEKIWGFFGQIWGFSLSSVKWGALFTIGKPILDTVFSFKIPTFISDLFDKTLKCPFKRDSITAILFSIIEPLFMIVAISLMGTVVFSISSFLRLFKKLKGNKIAPAIQEDSDKQSIEEKIKVNSLVEKELENIFDASDTEDSLKSTQKLVVSQIDDTKHSERKLEEMDVFDSWKTMINSELNKKKKKNGCFKASLGAKIKSGFKSMVLSLKEVLWDNYSSLHCYFLTAVNLGIITYQLFLEKVLQFFTCVKFSTTWYLRSHSDIQCFEGLWLKWLWVFGILLLYVIAFPIVLFLILYFNRKKIKRGDKKFGMYFGTLFSNYRENYYWFELIMFFRRLIIVTLINFNPYVPEFFNFLIVALLMLMFIMQLFLKPFRKKDENFLESLSLLCLVMLQIIRSSKMFEKYNTISMIAILIFFVPTFLVLLWFKLRSLLFFLEKFFIKKIVAPIVGAVRKRKQAKQTSIANELLNDNENNRALIGHDGKQNEALPLDNESDYSDENEKDTYVATDVESDEIGQKGTSESTVGNEEWETNDNEDSNEEMGDNKGENSSPVIPSVEDMKEPDDGISEEV